MNYPGTILFLKLFGKCFVWRCRNLKLEMKIELT